MKKNEPLLTKAMRRVRRCVQMSLDSGFTEHAFIIPYRNRLEPSSRGWSIWTFTDLDWALLSSLPGKYYMRAYCCEELECNERLLTECFSDALNYQ